MSHKTTLPGLLLAALLAFAPAQAEAQQPSPADIDRLLEVMDMEDMMSGMMQQMLESQQAMVLEAFGKNLSPEDSTRAQAMMKRTQERIQQRMSWDALEPIFRNVYMRVFTKEEVGAMTAFYDSPVGASILRKTPQAAAVSMQEMQPLMQQLMQDVQSDIQKELATRQK